MKIAIVTDDSNTISAHFGRALYYEVFTIADGQIAERETRIKANHHNFAGESHVHQHGSEHGVDPASQRRHDLMIEPINDCQFLIARGMGTGAYRRLESSGIHPIITDVEDIEEAINSYLIGKLTDHPEKLH